jgi:ribonuclease T1
MAKLFGRWVVVVGAAVAACSLTFPVQARESASSAPYCAALQGKDCDVPIGKLPAEAQKVQSLILQGGPFRYEKDGVVFGNREGLLPRERRGFYREYTVPTPGARNRGARRIVCGGFEAKVPETCYYTGDHYASFRRIVK